MRDDILEAGAMLGRRGGQPQIGVDNFDGLGGPAQAFRPLAQGILQPQALLVGEDLLRRRLADVNEV